MSREQFTIAVSQLRQAGDDAGAVGFWLKNGWGVSWSAFQDIDPMGDHGIRREKEAKAAKDRSRWEVSK